MSDDNFDSNICIDCIKFLEKDAILVFDKRTNDNFILVEHSVSLHQLKVSIKQLNDRYEKRIKNER